MEEAQNETIVQEIKELTQEERAEAWMQWVKSEVNAALDIYLAKSKIGHVNVKYLPHIVEMQEAGPVVDDSVADGVILSVMFEFESPVDLK